MPETLATPVERKPVPTVDVKLIIPFVNSVRSVFQTMVKVETTVNAPKTQVQSRARFMTSPESLDSRAM